MSATVSLYLLLSKLRPVLSTAVQYMQLLALGNPITSKSLVWKANMFGTVCSNCTLRKRQRQRGNEFKLFDSQDFAFRSELISTWLGTYLGPDQMTY